jgi:hypothetical protein
MSVVDDISRLISFLRDPSMELYEETRPELEAFFTRYRERGSRFCRIRVIETPLTPYVHWELHCLRIRAQCGEHIRVVPAQRLSALEPLGRLVPELVSLCGATQKRSWKKCMRMECFSSIKRKVSKIIP